MLSVNCSNLLDILVPLRSYELSLDDEKIFADNVFTVVEFFATSGFKVSNSAVLSQFKRDVVSFIKNISIVELVSNLLLLPSELLAIILAKLDPIYLITLVSCNLNERVTGVISNFMNDFWRLQEVQGTRTQSFLDFLERKTQLAEKSLNIHPCFFKRITDLSE